MEYSNNLVISAVHQGGHNRPGPMSIALLWVKLWSKNINFACGGAQIAGTADPSLNYGEYLLLATPPPQL
jgi:hypothetical protein